MEEGVEVEVEEEEEEEEEAEDQQQEPRQEGEEAIRNSSERNPLPSPEIDKTLIDSCPTFKDTCL